MKVAVFVADSCRSAYELICLRGDLWIVARQCKVLVSVASLLLTRGKGLTPLHPNDRGTVQVGGGGIAAIGLLFLSSSPRPLATTSV